MENILEMRNIVKDFPGLRANDHIDFSLHKGEIHALLGENGAGKSTLMNVLCGLYIPEEGEIYLAGEKVSFSSPKQAISHGIGMVHQHFMLIPAMTVAENIILGIPSDQEPWLQLNAAKEKIRHISQKYGFNIEPNALVSQLSVGEQQRVEIIKALYRAADILILDEPTAVLTPEESKGIFRVLRTLVAEGLTVIFISHKLNEVKEICDRVTVLRDGAKIATVETSSYTQRDLAKMMVGRDVIFDAFPAGKKNTTEVLVVEKLGYEKHEQKKLHNVSFKIHAGEILGLAGVDGNGQSELAKALTGLLKPTSGSISILGENLAGKQPIDFINNNVAHIPEDRNLMGLVGKMDVIDNLVIKNIKEKRFGKLKGWKLNHKDIRRHAEELTKEYDVRCASIDTSATKLSGGNQQKIILARELEVTPKLLVAVHPSRGLDVNATDFVHREIIRVRDEGTAVLLISGDLDEILRLSDRIACIFEGEIMGIIPKEKADIAHIGLMMAGNRAEEGENEN